MGGCLDWNAAEGALTAKKLPERETRGVSSKRSLPLLALRRKVGPSATGLVARSGGKTSWTLRADLHHNITSFMQLKVNQFQEWSCFESILFG